jgi:hypothetical protein
MKKITLIGLVTLWSAAAYAQGTVTFLGNVPGTIQAEVYSPNPLTPTVQEQGPTAGDIATAGYTAANGYSTAASTPTTYAGTLLGGSSYTGATPVSFAGAGANVYKYGNLFTAELFAISTTTVGAIAPGTTLASLSPVTQYQSTFNTGGGFGPGFFNEANPASPDPGIPGTGFIGTVSRTHTGTAYLGNNATAAVVAWFNGGGQFSTLAAAQAASVPWGQSSIFEITGLDEPASVMTQDNNNSSKGDQGNVVYLIGTDNNTGFTTALQSFNLTQPVPEPSTIALGVMGACAFLARRRKK